MKQKIDRRVKEEEIAEKKGVPAENLIQMLKASNASPSSFFLTQRGEKTENTKRFQLLWKRFAVTNSVI